MKGVVTLKSPVRPARKTAQFLKSHMKNNQWYSIPYQSLTHYARHAGFDLALYHWGRGSAWASTL